MPPNEKKRPSENFTDKLRAVLGLNASPKTKDGLPPQARFSIWYFLVAILLFSYLQPLIFSCIRSPLFSVALQRSDILSSNPRRTAI